jgi:hypothetical protein
MSNWNEEVYETLSRLEANGNEKSSGSLAASVSSVTPEDDQLCASLIERSLAASVIRSESKNNNPAMELYNSIFGFEQI